MDGETDGVGLLLGNQRKGIVAIAIPLAVALLFQNLNNIVDSLWVSDLGGSAMAALGIVYPLYCVQLAIGNGLGIGVSAAIARHIGMKDRKGAEKAAAQGLVVSVQVSLIFTPLLVIVAPYLFPLMGAEEIADECMGYAFPLFVSTFPIVLSGIMAGMLRGEGAAKRSMIMQAAGAVVNIVLDPIMIFWMDMGVAGAAWATVISFGFSCVLAIVWYIRGRGLFVRIRKEYLIPDAVVRKDIFSVGLPEALELSVMNVFNIALNYCVLYCGGTDGAAIYSSSWRVFYILMVPAQAMGGALVSVCSAEYGMGRFDMIRDGFRFTASRAFLLLVLFSMIAATMADPIAGVFTHSEGLRHMQTEMRNMILMFCLFLPMMSFIYTGSSLMQAVDRARGGMYNSLARNLMLTGLFFFGAYCFGTLGSLWILLAIGEITGGLMMLVHAVVVFRRAEAAGPPSDCERGRWSRSASVATYQEDRYALDVLIVFHAGTHAEHVADHVFGDDLCGRPHGDYLSLAHHYDAVAVPRGQLKVVGDYHYEDAPFGDDAPAKVHEVELMVDVQMKRRLIQKEDLWLLGQGLGDHHPSPFPSGELADVAVAESEDPCGLHGRTDDVHLRIRVLIQHPGAGIPPHSDDLHDREGEVHVGVLLDRGH
ncbi:MAG: MATE family efflux transporter, partial [Candidatus Methanomethylophilaceae archaeon]|nr:MATE family efflux transporter [Candidatus Methanomethylophilaceae archaeon]